MKEGLNYYFIGNASLISEDLRASSIEEAYAYLKDKDVISLDIETTRKYGGRYDEELQSKYGKKAPRREGLQPHLTEIVMVQLGTTEKQFIIDYRVTPLGQLLELLTDESKIIVGQNIKFEYLHFLHNEGIRINNVYDTMIAEQILFNGLNPGVSLKDLNKKYLDIEVDKTTALEFLSIGSKPFTLRQINYGAEDILYPLKIREQQIIDLEKKKVKNCMALEMRFLPCIGDIEYKGMTFNQSKWLNTYKESKVRYDSLKEELDNFILCNFYETKFVNKQLSLFDDELTCDISWTSSKQVVDFLRYNGACPMEKSKSTGNMAYTVNANVLRSSLNTDNKDQPQLIKDFINKYLDFKETEQSCTTFGIDFLKHVNPITNRLHSNYKQILTTGRISSSNPNLQNIPSKDDFRYCFDAPEGYKIVNADYSGQEQIILANKSGDKDLLAFYEKDLGDMHSYISSKIFPELKDVSLSDIKKLHPDKRQMAKAAGFAINYGGTGFTIANNLGVDESVGNFVYDSYFKAFPGLNNFFTKMKSDAKRRGYILIDPLTGRKYWTGDKSSHKVDKLAQNFPIQGQAGGITKYAVILMNKWILDNDLEDVISITNIVHDEINLEVKEEYGEQAARALEVAMNTAGDKWCKTIPLTAEAVVVDYWTH